MLKDIMQNRFACRSYEDKKLSDELVSEIVGLAGLSPSSLGLEPWQVYAIKEQDKLDRLSQIALNQKQVQTCSHALVVAARTDLKSGDKFFQDFINQKDEKTKAWYMGFIKDRFDKMNANELYNYASLQCYMLVANLVNIAYEKDVKSCIIGGFDKASCDEFLALESSVKSVLIITLGYSKELASSKKRRKLDDVLKFV